MHQCQLMPRVLKTSEQTQGKPGDNVKSLNETLSGMARQEVAAVAHDIYQCLGRTTVQASTGLLT